MLRKLKFHFTDLTRGILFVIAVYLLELGQQINLRSYIIYERKITKNLPAKRQVMKRGPINRTITLVI